MSNDTQSELAKLAYDAYCEHRQWKSVRGEPLPQFEAQAPELKEAWMEAAKAVYEYVRGWSGASDE